MERGTPTRYMAVETCDKVRRNVFCVNYNDCLNLTIRKKWPGFSCEECGAYEQEMLDRVELHDDYSRCMALAFVSGAVELHPASSSAAA